MLLDKANAVIRIFQARNIRTAGVLNAVLYAVVFSNAEKNDMTLEELKKIVEDFYKGMLPEWAGQLGNDFPDGIDDILDSW